MTAALLWPGENADAEDLSAHVWSTLKAVATGRLEIINGGERRRRSSFDQTLRIFPGMPAADANVRVLAARHDGYPNLPRAWRRQVNQGDLSAPRPARSVPIRMIETSPIWTPISAPWSANLIEITPPDGSRMPVDNDVDRTVPRLLMVLR